MLRGVHQSVTGSLINSSTHLIFLKSHLKEKTALYLDNGRTFEYRELEQQSNVIANKLIVDLKSDINQSICHIKSSANTHNVATMYGVQPRVALLCESDHSYVSSLYGIWKSGCIAVPMCKSHPKEELEYVIRDSGAIALITSSEYKELGHSLTKRKMQGDTIVKHIEGDGLLQSTDCGNGSQYCQITHDDWERLGGMLLYTSGTTGRPKGVLTTHSNIRSAQHVCVE